MTRSILFVAATILTTSACRQAQPGPDTNVANRSAFEARRDSEPERTQAFGADEALAPSSARLGNATQAVWEGGGSTPDAVPAMDGAGAGGAWAGAKGNISLEAK